MKKTILFALIAILFVAMFTGCRASYRRVPVTTPGYEITNTDGRTTRGFHYRNDGYAARDGVTRGHYRDGSVTHGNHPGRYHSRNQWGDGLITDSDGRIGNGTFADRPADRHGTTTRRTPDGVESTRHYTDWIGQGGSRGPSTGHLRGEAVTTPGKVAR